jgi:Lipid desaturase domain
LFALFFVSLGADLALIGPHPDWRMLPAALVAWYAADLVSGLVHMYMDYRPCIPGTGVRELYFWEGPRNTPEFYALQAAVYSRISLLERIVYDFKRHHPNPELLGSRSMFYLMKEPVLLSLLPVSLILNLVFVLVPTPGWLIVGVVVFIIGASMVQVFHSSLHRQKVGFGFRLMRKLGLLMSVPAHQLHHDSLAKDFSVISGWSNPVVNLFATFLLRIGALRPEGLEPT